VDRPTVDDVLAEFDAVVDPVDPPAGPPSAADAMLTRIERLVATDSDIHSVSVRQSSVNEINTWIEEVLGRAIAMLEAERRLDKLREHFGNLHGPIAFPMQFGNRDLFAQMMPNGPLAKKIRNPRCRVRMRVAPDNGVLVQAYLHVYDASGKARVVVDDVEFSAMPGPRLERDFLRLVRDRFERFIAVVDEELTRAGA
jgi:hypothetical protein